MPRVKIEMPSETGSALKKLAEFTGADSAAKLIQDALRTYAWIIYHQMQGRKIVVLESRKKKDELVTFVLAEKKKELEAYFAEDLAEEKAEASP